MRLRSHLLILVCGVLLPLIAFGVATAVFMVRHENDVFRRGAMERTLAMRTALDTELIGHATSLSALASSRNLEVHNLRAFYEEAVRVLPTQSSWRSVRLTTPAGEPLFDTDLPFGAKVSPWSDDTSFEEATRRRRPAVGNLFLDDDGDYRFAVRLPVLSDHPAEDLEYVLSVLVDPATLLGVLSPQRLAPDWVGAVLDANRAIAARTINHDATMGRVASESLRAALDQASEGWFRGPTLEGVDVYASYNRSPLTGWTVAVGVPVEDVEAGAFQIMVLLTSGLLGAAAMAVILAIGLSRRISNPISELATAARAIGAGDRRTPPVAASVHEVREVSHALAAAATAVHEREEELRAADRAKDEFLAMLGHELRNPLAALTSAIQVLQMTLPRDERLRATAGILERQIHRMTRLVDDLLDVSRVTSGKVNLSRNPLDLAQIVTNVVGYQRASGLIDAHDVQVDVTPVWIDGDEARIEQIVSNLLGNALKYTPAGGRVTVRAGPSEGGHAVLQVSDTGMGIAPELLPRIFDLFVQAEPSAYRGQTGLGVGLTLVKRLAELHGGTIEAQSEGPGHGATFTLRLPMVEPDGHAGDRNH